MAVDQWDMFSNEAERVNWFIYDDFEQKEPFGLSVYIEIYQRFMG